jgi:hypothetical protein
MITYQHCLHIALMSLPVTASLSLSRTGWNRRCALEKVWWIAGHLESALLLNRDGIDDALHRRQPRLIERRRIVGMLPIRVRQLQHGTQAVELVFALMQMQRHARYLRVQVAQLVGAVGDPLAAIRSKVECIGPRVQKHTLHLTIDDASDHALQMQLLHDVWNVRQNLVGAITQPHGVDISSDNECILATH